MTMGISGKISAYLQLIRLPNIFTAIADIIAGYLLVRCGQIHSVELFGLIVSTSGIYGAGCAYNDLCDLKIDQVERPFRPIPSGKISRREAAVLTAVLFAIGLAGAALAGFWAFIIACVLIVLVILYDRLSKDIPILGSLNMAACRGGNLLLGMSPVALGGMNIIFPFVSMWYVFFLTTISKHEVDGRPGVSGWLAFSGIISVFGFLLVLVGAGWLRGDALCYMVLMALCVLPVLLKAVCRPKPENSGQAVKMMILAIPLLDAVYVSGVHGVQYGIPVALCIFPAILISCYLYMT